MKHFRPTLRFSMMLSGLYAAAVLSFVCLSVEARTPGPERVSIAFWNAENLFDTIPSAFYDDKEYTPEGRLGWNTERYRRKLGNLSRVIDAMAPDVIGLAEVENETVIRDLVMTLKTDYNYIHRTTSDRRGIDQALLYKGDKFIPGRIRQIPNPSGREFLYIRGELHHERVDIVVCHLASQLNNYERRAGAISALYRFADSLHRSDPASRLIIMGDFNATPTDRIMRECFRTGKQAMDGSVFLFNPLLEMERKGYGSYVYKDRWYLYDNLFLDIRFLSGDGPLRHDRSGIFIRGWMLSPGGGLRRGYPLRTFTAGAYLDGFSDHLPVFTELIF